MTCSLLLNHLEVAPLLINSSLCFHIAGDSVKDKERWRMERCRRFSHLKPRKLRFVTCLGCMIAILTSVGLLKYTLQPFLASSLQLSVDTTNALVLLEETRVYEQQGNQIKALPPPFQDMQPNNSNIEEGKQTQDGKIICDFSKPRSDTCSVQGDVRVLGSSIYVVLAQPYQFNTSKAIWKIKPYTRKWESYSMEGIEEVSIKYLTEHQEIPVCAAKHTVPSIIFSTGGQVGNYFHDFTDVIIPLFAMSRQYKGKVQFLITNYKSWWIDKYQLILRHLSQYEIINLDTENRVHCFSEVQVGLKSHKNMGIDPSETPNGYSMTDFKDFLRTIFLLKRKNIERMGDEPSRQPRLLIMSRKGSRMLTNEKAVIKMARGLGYKIVVAGPEEAQNLTQIASIVNSCDVMMGVHGAGLTNMIFLPENAVLIQIVPWGGLKWACRHDFGEPAPDMGIKYLEYEIKKRESSLIKQYPRNHAVFKDPLSIHKQGFGAVFDIFLKKQDVKLDVGRFRNTLLEALQSLKQ